MNWHKVLWIALAVALGLTQLALIIAKLTDRIHCSWFWTLTPLWSPLACLIVVVVIGVASIAQASSNGGNPFR